MKKLVLKAGSAKTGAARERSCAIWVGRGILSNPALWKQDPVLRNRGQAFLIADARLGAHASRLERVLRVRGWKARTLRIPAREGSKDLRALEPLYRGLIEGGADRESVIFALGGGVIGDVSGFIAATYMRGIRWVGVPTTLLAQVDSSVGGKTGVNHALGKNLIGAFHQPSSVICDLSLLESLPEREILSGLGEIAKYALLSDARFYHWVSGNWDGLVNLEESVLEKAVLRCLKIKARIVELDEREEKGLRARLNLGHTVGHALETATGFRYFRHGEAVVHGLKAMLHLSLSRGHLEPRAGGEILGFLERVTVPAVPLSVSAKRVSALTYRDKKASAGKRRFILLTGLGKTVCDEGVTERELLRALEQLRERRVR